MGELSGEVPTRDMVSVLDGTARSSSTMPRSGRDRSDGWGPQVAYQNVPIVTFWYAARHVLVRRPSGCGAGRLHAVSPHGLGRGRPSQRIEYASRTFGVRGHRGDGAAEDRDDLAPRR